MSKTWIPAFAGMTLVLVASLSYGAAPRRESEIFSVETRMMPFSKLKDPAPGTYQERLEVQTENIRMRVGMPPMRFNAGRTFFGTAFSYEQIHFNYKNWDPTQEPSRVDTVHVIQTQIFLRQKLRAPNWHLRGFLSGGFNSDFASVTLRAARAQGGLMAEREVPSGSVSIGLVVIDDYGRTRVYPSLGLEQTFRKKHKISFRVPTLLSYAYEINERVDVGAIARVSGTNARLEEDGGFKGKTLSYSLATIGPGANLRLNKWISVKGEAGWTLRHKYQIFSGRDRIRDFDLKNSYFVYLGVRFTR